MKITGIETFTVGAGWKNWLFVKVHTDAGIQVQSNDADLKASIAAAVAANAGAAATTR